MTDLERELRDRFAALKRADERAAPAFTGVMARSPREAPVGRLVLALAAAVVLLMVVWVGGGHEPVAFVYPTDFLLDVPGADLLRTVPELGAIPEVRFN